MQAKRPYTWNLKTEKHAQILGVSSELSEVWHLTETDLLCVLKQCHYDMWIQTWGELLNLQTTKLWLLFNFFSEQVRNKSRPHWLDGSDWEHSWPSPSRLEVGFAFICVQVSTAWANIIKCTPGKMLWTVLNFSVGTLKPFLFNFIKSGVCKFTSHPWLAKKSLGKCARWKKREDRERTHVWRSQPAALAAFGGPFTSASFVGCSLPPIWKITLCCRTSLKTRPVCCLVLFVLFHGLWAKNDFKWKPSKEEQCLQGMKIKQNAHFCVVTYWLTATPLHLHIVAAITQWLSRVVVFEYYAPQILI